jgi:hypothetical protein
MTWLTSLPAAVLVISGLVLALLVVVGARLAVRALVPAAERDAASTIAAPLMPALGAIFALLMGLTLASEVGFLASAQGIVSSEAADASRLAWAATSPGVDSEPIQSALLGYLQAVRAHEWNGSTAATGDDPATTHAIASLENAVRTQAARPALGTPASTELLASLDALTSDRRARLAAASRQLPALFVAVLLLTGVALIVNAAGLTLRSGRRAALLIGGLAAVIGLSLALLFALGTPWRGPITVSGQPIDAVVRDLNTGYFHPLPRPTRGQVPPGSANWPYCPAVGAKWGAIIGRREATSSLLNRSILLFKQVPSYGQRHQPTVRISFASRCGGREWWAGWRPSPGLSPMRGLPDGGLHVRGDRHARGAVQPMWPGG